MEMYRSGHNEAVSKTVRHVTVSRGFESHRLRQNTKEMGETPKWKIEEKKK